MNEITQSQIDDIRERELDNRREGVYSGEIVWWDEWEQTLDLRVLAACDGPNKPRLQQRYKRTVYTQPYGYPSQRKSWVQYEWRSVPIVCGVCNGSGRYPTSMISCPQCGGRTVPL